MSLSHELRCAGYTGDCDQFRETVAGTFYQMYWTWTDEDLLCAPRVALHFCQVVRQRAGVTDLTDRIILRTLTNIRKATARTGRRRAWASK